MNHLRMAFLHAQIRQPAECERWINEARKYAYINPQNWYITAASACLECGLYPQALIYADSALVNLKYKVISSPHLVKAIALSRTGKTAEAEEWTQRCITDIRHFQAKHQIHTISYLQYQLFMEYAVSLHCSNNVLISNSPLITNCLHRVHYITGYFILQGKPPAYHSPYHVSCVLHCFILPHSI